MRRAALFFAFAAIAAEAPQRMEIQLERKASSGWSAVDPSTVFRAGDLVRFRFRASFPGYLYVINHGTSGKSAVLFPANDSGRENRVEANRDYLVPATSGAFRITGPAGHDVLVWVVSASPLAREAAPPAPAEGPARDLAPRCNDAIFRTRGDCVDDNAGPKAAPSQRSRDLIFIRRDKLSVISSASPIGEPVLYEYRLAHK
ncbi:MAG: DUF4384 domain-containing protein [Bryobacteraceae bacterium]